MAKSKGPMTERPTSGGRQRLRQNGGSRGPKVIERGYGAVSNAQVVGQQAFRPTATGSTTIGPAGNSPGGTSKSKK